MGRLELARESRDFACRFFRAAGLPGTGLRRVGAFACGCLQPYRSAVTIIAIATCPTRARVHRSNLRWQLRRVSFSARQISWAPRAAHKSRQTPSQRDVYRLALGMPFAPWAA